jgi:16S rRNA (guanine527-N7)-methyltransferase
VTREAFAERLTCGASRAGVTLSPQALEQFQAYYDVLRHWNRRVNLTAFSLDQPSEQAIDRLFVEPIAASRVIDVSAGGGWVDVGSGGGSPAIPLRILRPLPHLTMIESKTRKAAFLREAVRALGLAGVVVEERRFEDYARATERGYATSSGPLNLVTIRAVRMDLPLIRLVEEMLSAGGRLLLFGAKQGISLTDGLEEEGWHELTSATSLLMLRRHSPGPA